MAWFYLSFSEHFFKSESSSNDFSLFFFHKTFWRNQITKVIIQPCFISSLFLGHFHALPEPFRYPRIVRGHPLQRVPAERDPLLPPTPDQDEPDPEVGRKVHRQLHQDGPARRGVLRRSRDSNHRHLHQKRRPQQVHDGRWESQVHIEPGKSWTGWFTF